MPAPSCLCPASVTSFPGGSRCPSHPNLAPSHAPHSPAMPPPPTLAPSLLTLHTSGFPCLLEDFISAPERCPGVLLTSSAPPTTGPLPAHLPGLDRLQGLLALLLSPPLPASPWLPWPTTLQVPRPPRPLLPGPAVCVDKHTAVPGLGTGSPPPPSRPLPRPPNRPQALSAPWWTVAGWPSPSLPGSAGQGPLPAPTQVMPTPPTAGGRTEI